MTNQNTPQARLLARLMSDLSEEYFCAGWLTNCEYALWADLTGKIVDHHQAWGVTEEEKEELSFLHLQAGGWVIWSQEEQQTKFVTTQEWLAHLAASTAYA